MGERGQREGKGKEGGREEGRDGGEEIRTKQRNVGGKETANIPREARICNEYPQQTKMYSAQQTEMNCAQQTMNSA